MSRQVYGRDGNVYETDIKMSLNKSAKDMFEELGYINDEISNNYLGYGKLKQNAKKYITFVDVGTTKYFTIIETDRNNPTIELEELKAINKQIEELGWLDEKN